MIKKISTAKKAILLLVMLASCFLMLQSHKSAFAYIPPDGGGVGIGSESPATNSGKYSTSPQGFNYNQGTSIQPYYVIGNNDGDYAYSSLQIRVYVNKSWSGGLEVTIPSGFAAAGTPYPGPAPDCHSVTTGGLNGPDYDNGGGSPPAYFAVFGASGNTIDSQTISNGGCAKDLKLFIPNVGAAYSITPTRDYDGFFILQARVESSLNQGENSFTVTVNSLGSPNAAAGQGSLTYGMGYRDRSVANGNYWSAWSSFAMPYDCNEINSPSSSAESVTIKDPDGQSHPEWSSNMIFWLQQQQINDKVTGTTISQAPPSWTDVPGINAVRQQSQGEIGDADVTFNFTAHSDYRYRVVVASVGVRNTLRFQISGGLSTLYSRLSERPTLGTCQPPPNDKAACAGITASDTTPAVGIAPVITVNVKNTGTTTWDGSYYLTQTQPSRSDPNRNVSGSVPPGSTAPPFTYAIGARSSPQTVTFNYKMARPNGSTFGQSGQASDPAVCSISITWHSNINDAACASISATNTTPNINSGVTISVKIKNVGQTQWGSNYNLTQTSPARSDPDRALSGTVNPGSTTPTFTYAISARTTAQTVTFDYRMVNSSGTEFGPNPTCSIDITWRGANTPNAKCTSAIDNRSPAFGQNVTITVRLYNTGTTDFPGSYQLRQGETGQAGTTQAQLLGSTLASDNDQYFYFTINGSLGARAGPGSPFTTSFNYTLFNGNTAGASVVPAGKQPLCTTNTITWGCTVNCQPNQQAGTASIDAQCGYTSVAVSVHAIWHKVAPFGTPSTLLIPGTNRLKAGTEISNVPVHIEVTADDGSGSATYDFGNGGIPNNSTAQIPTFTMMGGMWPHKTYHMRLIVEGADVPADSSSYDDNGNWGYYTDHDFGTVAVNNGDSCMEANCSNSTAPDAEPGQRNNYSYAVHVNNHSTEAYSPSDPNGYHIDLNTSPGFAGVAGVTYSHDISGDNEIVLSFNARLDYSASFTVNMGFQGGDLDLPGLDHPCPNADTTPATRPFFQVWNGDTSAGGGFRNINTSCQGAGDPPFVTSFGSADNSLGGIRAFGSLTNNNGSMTEFGAFSQGVITGKPSGPLGFYSGHGIIFANRDTPAGNIGGYLNSNSQAHCTNDFFTNTRKSLSLTGFSGGSVNGLPTGQYLAGNDITITGGNIPRGHQVTIYVDGDVTIDGNISYDATWNPATRSDIPYLAIIARGNIITTNNVKRLDGLYIAQPTASNPANTGTFSTCTTNAPDNSFCPSQLLVNGAVIAQRVRLMRIHGTAAIGSPIEADINNICTPYPPNSCPPAEIFNFVPSMVLGAPNFGPLSNQVEGLFSLPPVF